MNKYSNEYIELQKFKEMILKIIMIIIKELLNILKNIIILFISILLIKIIYNQLNNKIYKRPNELDDNYDYFPKLQLNI